jgi:VCBS repeat-containing protein
MPLDDSPIANNDINNTLSGLAVSGDVSTNDYLSIDGGNTWSLLTGVSNGTLVFNPDGSYTYTSDSGYVGTDSFTYTLCDGNGDCSQATVSITVNPPLSPSTNNPPVAVNDNTTGISNTPISGNLLSNDYDPDGDSLSASVIPVTPPSHGTVTINPDGTYTYIPDSSYVGTDSFTYEVCDNGTPVQCSQGTVTITILPLTTNITVANDDNYITQYNTPLLGDVSLNDYDPEGDIQGPYTLNTIPLNGTITFNTDGSFTTDHFITYLVYNIGLYDRFLVS